MKLSYSIPKKVWWITNFLDYHMYKGIHDAIIKEREKINGKKTFFGYIYKCINNRL